MHDYFCTDLFRLVEHHAQRVASLQTLRQRIVDGDIEPKLLEQAAIEEELVRNELIRLRPSSLLDAQTKLLYLVYFLASTKSSFDRATIQKILESVDHLR